MFIIECDNDEALIRSLGISKKNIRHVAGKGRVVNCIEQEQGKFGMVDEDPKSAQPRKMEEFNLLEEIVNVKLLKHKNKDLYLIVIPNYLEDFLVSRSNQVGLDLSKYKLPNSGKQLHSKPKLSDNLNFINFLRDLVLEDSLFKTFKKWLKLH